MDAEAGPPTLADLPEHLRARVAGLGAGRWLTESGVGCIIGRTADGQIVALTDPTGQQDDDGYDLYTAWGVLP